ncbi:hypothetical protein [Metabacillus arenae]|nr:hypothetical protein [Metabacillus arenae]
MATKRQVFKTYSVELKLEVIKMKEDGYTIQQLECLMDMFI